MSIIRKERTTEEYKKKLEILPHSTKNGKIDAANKFQKFCKKYHDTTPEEICKELLILKKQNEEEYVDALYDILQEWIVEIFHKRDSRYCNLILIDLMAIKTE